MLSGRHCSGVRRAQVPGGWGLALSPWASGSYNNDKMHPSSVSVAGLQLTPVRTTAPAQCQPRGLPPNTQDARSHLLSRQSTEATSTTSLLDAAWTGLALARAVKRQPTSPQKAGILLRPAAWGMLAYRAADRSSSDVAGQCREDRRQARVPVRVAGKPPAGR